jgi:hypothetical protein
MGVAIGTAGYRVNHLNDNAFVKRVLAQPKLWVIGEGRGVAA